MTCGLIVVNLFNIDAANADDGGGGDGVTDSFSVDFSFIVVAYDDSWIGVGCVADDGCCSNDFDDGFDIGRNVLTLLTDIDVPFGWSISCIVTFSLWHTFKLNTKQ